MKKLWKFSCPIPGRAEQDPQEGRSSLVALSCPLPVVGPWGGALGAAGARPEPVVAGGFGEVCVGLG